MVALRWPVTLLLFVGGLLLALVGIRIPLAFTPLLLAIIAGLSATATA